MGAQVKRNALAGNNGVDPRGGSRTPFFNGTMVDGLWSPMTWLETLSVAGIVTLGLGGLGIYLKAYLADKGRNLATKEDVAALTRPVEEIRSEFRLQEERVRATLAKELQTHNLTFQEEFRIYKDLWGKVIDLRDHVTSVSSWALSNQNDTVKGCAAYSDFRTAMDRFALETDKLRPFFSPEVNKALFILTLTYRKVAVEDSLAKGFTQEQATERLQKTVAETVSRTTELENAIRARLYPGSQPTSALVSP